MSQVEVISKQRLPESGIGGIGGSRGTVVLYTNNAKYEPLNYYLQNPSKIATFPEQGPEKNERKNPTPQAMQKLPPAPYAAK